MRRAVFVTGQRLRVACLLVGAALGTSFGCLTTLAPNLRQHAYHRDISNQSSRAACMTCHLSENQMSQRMRGMTSLQLQQLTQRRAAVVHPSLVQDWMLSDRRTCVGCHRVRESR